MVYIPAHARHIRRALLASALPLVLSVAVVPAASAQENVEQARARFMEGRTYYDNDQYEQAAAAFLESYELSGRSELLYNVGQAYRLAGMLSEAETYFQRYLAELPGAANAEEVAETIIEIQQTIAATLATLSVSTSPQGATVLVEERDQRCNSPCDLDLPPGTYQVVASLPDFEQTRREVTLEARAREELTLTLQSAVQLGQLLIQTDLRGATLYVGPQSYPLPMSSPVSVPAGDTAIAIRGGGVDFRDTLTIPADDTLTLFVPAAMASSGGLFANPVQTAAVGFSGVGLALGAAAALVGMQSNATYASLEAQQAAFGNVNSELLDTGIAQQRTANGLWIGAAVSLVAGAGLFTWDLLSGAPDEAPTPTPEVKEEEEEKPQPSTSNSPVELLD
ncbi:PEGA domain-containing protein [Lujinxingia litoralis]|nr:PEGA domain-containing protein [Lujinxingia litoralis]